MSHNLHMWFMSYSDSYWLQINVLCLNARIKRESSFMSLFFNKNINWYEILNKKKITAQSTSQLLNCQKWVLQKVPPLMCWNYSSMQTLITCKITEDTCTACFTSRAILFLLFGALHGGNTSVLSIIIWFDYSFQTDGLALSSSTLWNDA